MLVRQVIALEARLKKCPNIITFGVRPNFEDYPPVQRQMLLAAEKIYYPTAHYADLFDAMGKATFPSYHTYKVAQDKIKQTALFKMAGIPHPRTRVFYGNHQKKQILKYFDLPLIAKVARGSALGRGVYLISTPAQLADYCHENHVAYIQEYLPIPGDMRVVVIGGRAVHAYWRITPEGDFRSNVSAGGTIGRDPVPPQAIQLAIDVARRCRWDDVGIDICCHQGRYYVLEGNLKYGKQGFSAAGIDYLTLMSDLIEKRVI